MGLEARTRVTLNGREDAGIAHCGDGEIDFRGEARLRWKWSDLTRIAANDGVLSISRNAETAEFFLGPDAEKWLARIKNPKPRLDKLGLKADHRYRTIGQFEDTFAAELRERAGCPCQDRPLDVVFVRVDGAADLDRLLEAKREIVPNGMIWAVWPKGRKELREDDIRTFALAHGLVDVKVASFDGTRSALKLVIPVALRPTSGGRSANR